MSSIIVKTKTIDGEVRTFDRSKLNEIEEVLVLRQHRGLAHGELIPKRYSPGEKYKVSGLNKAEGIMYGYTTLDLNAKIPVSKKRSLKDAEQSKKQLADGKDAFVKMQKQIDDLTAIVEKLTAGKK